MVEIREVKTRKERLTFIEFPNKMYRDNPYYVPSLVSDEMTNIDEKKNPAFDFCDMRFFLAYKDGKLVGRVGGIINHASNDKWDQQRIRLTRLDFIDDYEVSAALMKTIEDWGREQKLKEIVGPVGFCDQDKEGMLIDGFNEPSMFITYYNHPYYMKHMEKLGYAKDVDWVESRLYTKLKEEEKMAKLCEFIKRRYKLKVVNIKNKKQLKPYIKKLFDMVDREYSKLYGSVPFTPRLIEHYLGQFLILVDCRFVKFIENEQGEVIAFGLAVANLNEPVRRSHGHLFPFGWAEFLWRAQHAKILDLYLIAVDSDHRNSGASALLIWEMLKVAREAGIEVAETGPNLEENQNIRALWNWFEGEKNIRRRRSWIKQL